MDQKFKEYLKNFYEINPDNLESEYISAVKSYYVFARLSSEAYVDQLISKAELKKESSRVFLIAKEGGATDTKAKEMINCDEGVVKKQKEYFDSLRKWEDYKDKKETILIKKDMLKSIGFERKNDIDVSKES